MWHKAIWKGHPMRLELTRVGLLVELANHYTTRGGYTTEALTSSERNKDVYIFVKRKSNSFISYAARWHIYEDLEIRGRIQKRETAEVIELPNKESVRTLGEKGNNKFLENWKWIPSNKQIWKEILEMSVSEEQENILKPRSLIKEIYT